MQTINDTDFQVEVKIDSVVSRPIQMQGIIVEQDANVWLRFDFRFSGTDLRVFSASFDGTSAIARVDAPICRVWGPLWMRVQRQGNTWTQSWSTDGLTFTQAASFSFAMIA